MNICDIAILMSISICLVAGAFRGTFKELFSILGLYLGTYAAFNYYMKFTKILSSLISNTMALKTLSFLIVFFEIYIIIIILGAIIRYVFKIKSSGWINRFLGAIMGTLKGTLIAAIALIIFTVSSPGGYILLKKSTFSPRLVVISEAVVEIASREIRVDFTEKLAVLKKAWKP